MVPLAPVSRWCWSVVSQWSLLPSAVAPLLRYLVTGNRLAHVTNISYESLALTDTRPITAPCHYPRINTINRYDTCLSPAALSLSVWLLLALVARHPLPPSAYQSKYSPSRAGVWGMLGQLQTFIWPSIPLVMITGIFINQVKDPDYLFCSVSNIECIIIVNMRLCKAIKRPNTLIVICGREKFAEQSNNWPETITRPEFQFFTWLDWVKSNI